MNSAQRQLTSIDVDKFRVVTINGENWLTLPHEDIQFGGSFCCGEGFNITDIRGWLMNWNIEQLTDLELSKSASYLSRGLTAEEKEMFEAARAVLARCQRYALNYYENDLFKRLSGK